MAERLDSLHAAAGAAGPVYPTTNVQLLAQMRAAGYSEEERFRVLRAYEVAAHLFTGLYQPSGAPFLVHVVRTAGILASLRVPADVVAAALLHTAFGRGDFGRGGRGRSRAKRRFLRDEVGPEVETLLLRYAELRWTVETIPRLHASVSRLDASERHVLAMKLANELDHHLDGEILHYGGDEPRRMALQGGVMAALADELGLPALAADLRRVARQTARELPADVRRYAASPRPFALIRGGGRNESRLVPPRSYRIRWRVAAAGALRRLRRRLKVRLLMQKLTAGSR